MNNFKVSFIPALEVNANDDFCIENIHSFDLAVMIKNSLADYTLFLHDRSLMIDYSNMAIIEQNVNGEWIDASYLEDIE